MEKSETVAVMTLLLLAMKVESPRYDAVTACVPSARLAALKVAAPFAKVT